LTLDLSKFAVDRGERSKHDLDLLDQWRQGGEKPDDLRPLLGNFRGLIRSQSRQWENNVELPPAAIRAEFTKQAVQAFRTYDPNKGASLGSWVGTNMKKAQRYVTTYQNTARIGEHRIYKIGQFQTTRSMLDDQLGREPTTEELADQLKWSPREVGRMNAEIRKANIESAFEGGPMNLLPSREAEVLRLVKYDLTPEEKLVYEYTVGDGGKPQLKPGQIATKLNMSPAKVTRVREAIFQKMKVHL
jgi:DNA-directed RNA polymerase specialized sigma subunit